MKGVPVNSLSLLVVMALVGMTWGLHPSLSRWTRQAIHCQPGDAACKMCSASCNTVDESQLPECCEAYNTCCDQYFQACKKCSSVAAKDQYFPEYCCASFTDCCHLVTTFKAPIKPPEAVRKEPKTDLKIPTVAAPKPTSFPGSSSLAAPITPAAPPRLPQPTTFPSSLSPTAPITPEVSPFPQAPFTSQPPVQPPALPSQFPPLRGSPDQTSSRVVVGSQRGQSDARSQQRAPQRSHHPTRSRRPQVSSDSQRRGRVTSRGRVIQ